MNNEQFMKLRAGDTINARLKIVEFGSGSDPHLAICSNERGDKCFIRSADIVDVANWRVKVGDCIEYEGSNGTGWGVVQSIVSDNPRWIVVWKYNDQESQPVVIREREVKVRKPIPAGYEWPRPEQSK